MGTVNWGSLIGQGIGLGTQLLGNRAINQGTQQAAQGYNAASNQAMQLIMSLYDRSQQGLQPFRNLAGPSLTNLSNLVNHTHNAVPAFNFGAPGPQGNANLPAGNTIGQQGYQTQLLGDMNLPGAQLQQSMDKNMQSAIGGLAGAGAGIGLGSLGALAGIGLGVPVIGPILAGIGALVPRLFNRHGADKAAAARGIDEVSQWVWGPNTDGKGGLAGALQSGQMTTDQAKQAFGQMWNAWIGGMKNAGVDPGTIQSSVASQKQYFQPWANLVNSMDRTQSAQNSGGGAPGGGMPPPQQPSLAQPNVNPQGQGQGWLGSRTNLYNQFRPA